MKGFEVLQTRTETEEKNAIRKALLMNAKRKFYYLIPFYMRQKQSRPDRLRHKRTRGLMNIVLMSLVEY